MEVDGKRVGRVDGANLAVSVVIRGSGVESGINVQCSEFCIENVVCLFKAVAGTDDLGCFAGESWIREIFGEYGEELVPAGLGAG